MVIEQQFVSFLLDRIDVKLEDIRKQTTGETAKLVVDETQIFVNQLKEALNTILSCDTSQHEEHPAPTPSNNRGGNSRRTNRGESA